MVVEVGQTCARWDELDGQKMLISYNSKTMLEVLQNWGTS
jgi:hypothetical protein